MGLDCALEAPRVAEKALHAGADPNAHAKTGETALSQTKRYN